MKEAVSSIFDSLKTGNRIQTLEMTVDGKSISEMSDELEMSTSSIHSYLKDFEEAGLLNREDEPELTDTGRYLLEVIEELENRLEEQITERQAEVIKQELDSSVGYRSPKGREILEQLLEEHEKESE